MNLKKGFLAVLIYFVAHGSSFAITCDNAKILGKKIITDVPWDQLYPIKLAGVRVSPKGKVLDGKKILSMLGVEESVDDIELKGNRDGSPWGASKESICSCMNESDSALDLLGVTSAMYEPIRLVEIVRNPDCLLSVGTDPDITSDRMQGDPGTTNAKSNQLSFWHYHYYAFPIMAMIEMAIPNRCVGSDYRAMTLIMVSELDPTWSDDELSAFTNPESFLLSSLPAMIACLVDVIPANLGFPIDKLYWCAGSWGTLYPLTGWNNDETSISNRTSLLATRAISIQHRRSFEKKTFGDDAVCGPKYYPHIPKNQYKMNMLYPVAEKNDAHKIGQSSLLWGEWRNKPTKEDAVYMLWGYRECCMTLGAVSGG